MSTYRFRLRFFVHAAGVIQDEQAAIAFRLPGGLESTFSCLDSQSISKGREFVLSCGGFGNEEDAAKVGKRLKDALVLSGAKLRLGIDAGIDKYGSMMYLNPIDTMSNENSGQFIDTIDGLTIYSEDRPVDAAPMSSLKVFFPSSADFFTNVVLGFYDAYQPLTEKEKLALELYGASHFEKSDRARFITLVLAAEALLEPKERGRKAKEVVDSLIELTNKSELTDQEKESIKGTLTWLYRESISRSLKEMASAFLGDKEYGGLTASRFILHCYDTRSKLVHAGQINEEKVNLGTLAAQLDGFLADLLLAKAEACRSGRAQRNPTYC